MPGIYGMMKRTTATTTKAGAVKKAAARADVGAYAAPTPGGAVPVTSAAATDLDDLAAQVVAQRTVINDLLAKLRTAGILST